MRNEELDKDKCGEHFFVYQFVAKMWSNKGPIVSQLFEYLDQPHWAV